MNEGYVQENYEFQPVEKSCKELEAEKDYLEGMIEERGMSDQITGVGIDYVQNCIEIYADNTFDECAVYNIAGNYSMKVLDGSQEMVKQTISWKPGRAIYRSGGEKASTGFRCKYNGYNAFVTAGHVGNKGISIYGSASATSDNKL